MKEEILVNVTPRETRAALVENGVLQEVQIERLSSRGIVGNIYKGKVSRVLPGMQAAFIEIGLERTAFLHASDIGITGEQMTGFYSGQPGQIQELVTEGRELLVQVLKDPLGTKGARLTTNIAIPSRYLVYMPRGTGAGVSTRIEDEAERERLRALLEELDGGDDSTGSFIVRTAAEGAARDALRADRLFLLKLWDHINERQQNTPAAELVYEDLPLSAKILRDYLGAETERVRVDSHLTHESMLRFSNTFTPELSPRIELYNSGRPIFDMYGVEDEIVRALDKKVPLKSGGYLIIDQTEAMTTIDVNTGAYVGHRNLEETIFKTNLEATHAIARQLRLRNLGGIIILDFIDMKLDTHQQQVLAALQLELARDNAKTYVCDVSPLGLVEMTRKRTRESLEHLLCESCPTCEGRGLVKTAETVCYEIFREILRQTRQFDFKELLILAHRDVIERMVDEESTSVAELEEFTGKSIRLQTESMYAEDQYDVVLM